MKRINIDHIILHIIFFASGIYILLRIFIPILNPTSLAIGSNYDGQNFYKQILRQASGAINITSSVNVSASVNSDTETSNGLISVLFTYLTGIDLSNPKTYISSVLPVLKFIDITAIESNEDNPNSGPIVIIPRDTDKLSGAGNTTSGGINKNNTNTSKANSKDLQNPGTISKINPADINVNSQKLDQNKPLVLIFHSHTTESYNPNQIKDKNFSPNDLTQTVSEVGNMLDYELETKYGISTIHNSTIHDLPRMSAYVKARPTVQYYLKKYPSLKLIIDLHRDGNVSKNIATAIINKDKYARVMLVVGTKFKNSEKYNLTSQRLYNVFESLYPNFCRKIDLKKSNSTYNQDLSPKMVLLEVGSDINNLSEAINSTKVISKVIAKFLK